MKINGIFEIAVRVKNLERSTKFYTEVLGFEHGLLDAERRWHFLWVGGRAGMVVLQEEKENWQQQHFAFSVSASDIPSFKINLERNKVSVHGPVELSWMNATTLYFADPDGHDIEFCAA